MSIPKGLIRRMYAVVVDGDIVAGTVAYSRKAAIEHFIGHTDIWHPNEWPVFLRSGYRTVKCGMMIDEARKR
jgi:hypothetical protein